MKRLARRAIAAMREHDDNPEFNDLWQRGDLIVGWQWAWLEWEFGLVLALDPKENPGVWLNVGPFVVGGSLARSRWS